MAVRIRMKKLGRKHRPYFRICAIDGRAPRDGKVIEELGTYDPMLSDTDARVKLKRERVDYWLSVGAQPSDKVGILIKKYGTNGSHVELQERALERLAAHKPTAPPPAPVPAPKKQEEKQEEAAAEATDAPAETGSEAGSESGDAEASGGDAGGGKERRLSRLLGTGRPMRFDVLTLFPDMFPGYLGQSLLHKAIQAGKVAVEIHDIRRWANNKHNKVDDRPFGGGPGMVLKVEPVVECVEAVQAETQPDTGHVVLLSPQGRTLNQKVVEELAEKPRLILLCGRYEGFDQRVIDILQPDEISVGDFVLNGGEVAAMVLIDTVIRLVPGVLGHEDSSREDSFSTYNRLLEWPQYTRPRSYRGHEVPDELLSGDHEAIARWRQQQSVERTKQRRADLLQSPDNL